LAVAETTGNPGSGPKRAKVGSGDRKKGERAVPYYFNLPQQLLMINLQNPFLQRALFPIRTKSRVSSWHGSGFGSSTRTVNAGLIPASLYVTSWGCWGVGPGGEVLDTFPYIVSDILSILLERTRLLEGTRLWAPRSSGNGPETAHSQNGASNITKERGCLHLAPRSSVEKSASHRKFEIQIKIKREYGSPEEDSILINEGFIEHRGTKEFSLKYQKEVDRFFFILQELHPLSTREQYESEASFVTPVPLARKF